MPPKTLTGRIGSSLKLLGWTAAVGVLGFAFAYLKSLTQQRFNDEEIKRQLRALRPEIASELEKRKKDIAQIQSSGGTVYANVTVTVEIMWYTGGDLITGPESEQFPPDVTLTSVEISDKKINRPGENRTKKFPHIDYYPFTFSFEI
jgi:hypothetical protein